MPAALTSRSTRPSSISSDSRKARSRSSWRERSAATQPYSQPGRAKAATRSAVCGLAATTATLQPCSISPTAIAPPSPRLPPVTIARFPLTSNSFMAFPPGKAVNVASTVIIDGAWCGFNEKNRHFHDEKQHIFFLGICISGGKVNGFQKNVSELSRIQFWPADILSKMSGRERFPEIGKL